MSDVADASSSRRRRRRRHSPTDDSFAPTPRPPTGFEIASNSFDVVLSMRSERYREIMLKNFNILGQSTDISREESVAGEVFAQLKKEGARFIKVERFGRRVIVDEKAALESIMNDIRRRKELVRSWVTKSATLQGPGKLRTPSVPDNSNHSNISRKLTPDDGAPVLNPPSALDEKTQPLSVECVNLGEPIISSAETYDKKSANNFPSPQEDTGQSPDGTGTKEHTSGSVQPSYPVSSPQDNTAHRVSVEVDSQSQFHRYSSDLHSEEKKQDDQDVAFPSIHKPTYDHDFGFPSEAKPKGELDVGISANLKCILQDKEKKRDDIAIEHSNEGNLSCGRREPTGNEIPKNEDATAKAIEIPPHHIILSLNNDFYKETMFDQFRILGKKADSNREAEVASAIYSFFKQKMGETGKFFKCCHDQDVPVNDDQALAKIVADIKRRVRSHSKWSTSFKQQTCPPPSLNSVSQTTYPASSASCPQKKSPLKTSTPRNEDGPRGMDIILTPKDLRYRGILWKHFNILGKKQYGDHHREEEAGRQIFAFLKKQIGNEARFFKKKARSNVILMVDDEGALAKIIKDITRRNESIHKWLSSSNSDQQQQAPPNAGLLDCPPSSTRKTKRRRLVGKDYLDKFFTQSKSRSGDTPTNVIRSVDAFSVDSHTVRVKPPFSLNHTHNSVPKRNNVLRSGCFVFSECGEKALKACFLNIAKALDDEARNTKETKIGRSRGKRRHEAYNVFNDTTDEDYVQPGKRSVFLRHFQTNQARLLDLKSTSGKDAIDKVSAIRLSGVAKRVKKGDKDRTLCMVVGCEKHSQTRCDGCCTAHYRLLSSVTFVNKKSSTITPACASNGPRSTSSSPLRKRNIKESEIQMSTLRHNSILSKLEPGSRIFVKWDGDNSLYKATAKKIVFDRKGPMVKIHYDGKKRHIFDTIPIEMVKKFIKGESSASKTKQAGKESQLLSVSQQNTQAKNIINFSALETLYPGTLQSGTNEITQPCPELGTGWQVYRVSKKTELDGPRTDRYFISPYGKTFQSVPDLEKYYWLNPNEFGEFGGKAKKPKKSLETVVPKFLTDEHLLDNEVSTINQSHLPTQLCAGSYLSTNHHNFLMAKRPAASYSPISSQPGGVRSLITISPIMAGESNKKVPAHSSCDIDRKVAHLSLSPSPEKNMLRPSSLLQSQVSHRSLPKTRAPASLNCLKSPFGEELQSPREVAALKSAFTSPEMKSQPTLHGQLNQNSNINQNVGVVNNDAIDSKRPRRKTKPVVRFDEEDIPSSRASAFKDAKSVLCHCANCDRRNLSVQGIYAHYGRAHIGKLAWQLVTFSCPYCPPARARIFNSFNAVKMHVNACHRGCSVVGPHPSKLAKPSIGVQNITPRKASKMPGQDQDLPLTSDRVLRERKSSFDAVVMGQPDQVSREGKPSSDAVDRATEMAGQLEAPQVNAQTKVPLPWTKIAYTQLLPDGRTEYPRDMHRIIDMIDEQCQKQKEIVAIAQEQRMKLCRNEAESDAKAFAEERLLYQRGVRERMRLADGERIEKQKFTEKAEQMIMQYQYENRNKRRNQEDVEVEKLCARPIMFVNETMRQSTRQGKACKNGECQFCTKENGYLHHLLLDSEISKFNTDATATSSLVFQQSTKVLNPSFRIIDDEHFLKAESSECPKNSRNEDCGKRVNQSRRDASTAKRLALEEDKLLMLKNTKHNLEFINKYNSGLMINPWGETKKTSWD